MMKRTFLYLLVFAFLLVGCNPGGSGTPTGTKPRGTEALTKAPGNTETAPASADDSADRLELTADGKALYAFV